MKRKFYLSDGSTTIDLNGTNGIWLINPSGLGSNISVGMSNMQNGYFVPYSNSNFKQQNITGDIIFTENAYERYKSFADFVSKAETLTLIYSYKQFEEYKRIVYPATMNKGELTKGTILQIPFTFNCLTPWYTEEEITSVGSTTSINVSSGGHIPTTVEINCNTTSTNPVITMVDSDSETVAKLVVNGSVSNLRYSNNPFDSFVMDGSEDIINSCVIENNIFGTTKKAFRINFTNISQPSVVVKRWYRTI